MACCSLTKSIVMHLLQYKSAHHEVGLSTIAATAECAFKNAVTRHAAARA